MLLQLDMLYFIDIHGSPPFSEQKRRSSGLVGGTEGWIWREGLEGAEGGGSVPRM